MKKALIILGILLVLALAISCSPDQLMDTGKALGGLEDVGLGSRKSKPVADATENVKAYISEIEKAYSWPDPLVLPSPEGEKDPTATVNDKALFISTVDKTVNLLLDAKNSNGNAKVLREALNAKYEGKTKDAFSSRSVYAGLKKDVFMGGLLKSIEDLLADEDQRKNMVLVLAMLGLKGFTIDSVVTGIDTVKKLDTPIPLQSYDYSIILNATVLGQVKSIQEVMKTVSSGSGSGGKKIDPAILTNFMTDIKNSVGKRTTQTVGDKIFIGIAYSLVNKVYDINTAYVASRYYAESPEGSKYDLFFDYVLSAPEGKALFDSVLNYLDAISYIYDVKLDIAGLVAGMV